MIQKQHIDLLRKMVNGGYKGLRVCMVLSGAWVMIVLACSLIVGFGFVIHEATLALFENRIVSFISAVLGVYVVVIFGTGMIWAYWDAKHTHSS